jgi:cathepsin B
MKTTWKAAVPIRFQNATIAEVKKQLGTIMPGEENYYAPEEEKTLFKTETTAIPDSFDARDAWPQCASVVGRVRDQSNCGSCWAFGSTEAFNDRYCIKTGDASHVFSPYDTLGCCSGISCGFSMGCNGGQPSGAWKYFVNHGVPTGGDWADVGTGSTCKPYAMKSCAHHVDPVPAGMVSCTEVETYKTPSCTATCDESAYGTAYSKDLVSVCSVPLPCSPFV